MRGFLMGLSVSVAFVLGCAASRFVVQPAQAQSPGPKWDYYCLGANNAEELTARAKAAGLQGWEMVGGTARGGSDFTNPIVCFKRPLQ